jgi:hypothetical protein
MKQAKSFILLIFLTQSLYSQNKVNEYEAIDKKALQIPESLTKSTEEIASYVISNFPSNKDKIRAIFIWTATNIQYDLENMFTENFYKKDEDKISKPLKTRKGICENYAALFNDICLKSGIKSYVIEGYTKQNGFTDYIPHAWCAAFIDNSWYLFDPTWGSGYVKNGKFYKKINNEYFKIKPSAFIRSHMPFDFLWQFLNYPVTYQEFNEGRTRENRSKPFFNFQDSIQVYENLSYVKQLINSSNRIEMNGRKNSLVTDRLQYLNLEIENERRNQTVNLYNAAVTDYNEGIKLYNDFIKYRNKQFTPQKTDTEFQSMIDSANNKLKTSNIKLSEIINPDVNTNSLIIQLTNSIDEAFLRVKEQQEWFKSYSSKDESGRKSMFYKHNVTWIGIPMN